MPRDTGYLSSLFNVAVKTGRSGEKYRYPSSSQEQQRDSSCVFNRLWWKSRSGFVLFAREKLRGIYYELSRSIRRKVNSEEWFFSLFPLPLSFSRETRSVRSIRWKQRSSSNCDLSWRTCLPLKWTAGERDGWQTLVSSCTRFSSCTFMCMHVYARKARVAPWIRWKGTRNRLQVDRTSDSKLCRFRVSLVVTWYRKSE